jgi:hypothetical protein
MKSVIQFVEMTAAERAKNLKSRVKKDNETKKEIAKILVAAEEKGDFGKGEMNKWSLEITGVELRREVQGTYEYATVLRGIRSGELAFTEEEFDKAPSFGLIKLAGFMGKKDGEKVAAALEIIRSGEDVTNRLRALTAKPKVEETETKDSKESKGSAPTGEGDSLNSDTPAAPKGTSIFIPEGVNILAVEEIQVALLAGVRSMPDSESCENAHEFLKGLVAQLHTRWEQVEAEAATSKEAVAA